jgi:uroporphyrin-III C-methyltransferase
VADKPATPNKPETPKILEEIASKNKVKPARAKGSPLAVLRTLLFSVLILALLAGMGFVAFQQYLLDQQLAAMRNRNQQLNLTISSQSEQLQQLQQQVAAPAEPLVIDDSAVREVESSLNSEIRAIQQQLARLQDEQLVAVGNDNRWKILEANYLLNLASQKLGLEADIDSAIRLMQNADAALLASGDNSVFSARQAITADLALLRELEPVDREGIYLRLANLIDKVDDIDLLNSMRQNFEDRRGEQSAVVQIGSGEGGVLDATLDFLGSVFVWRKWEETPEAMLAPGQETSIKQSFRLLLEQAQLALLQRDGDMYRQSLANCRRWLQRYAVTESAFGRDLMATLEQLDAINIAPVLPSLGQSLSALQLLANRER